MTSTLVAVVPVILYGGNSSLNGAPQCDETWELVPDRR
jgi:hypothetical protein